MSKPTKWHDDRLAVAMELHFGEGWEWGIVAVFMGATEAAVLSAVLAAQRRGMRMTA